MVALCAKITVLVCAWLVTACATDTARKNQEARLVRRAPRKHRNVGNADTVVAQIQPHGDVVSSEVVERIGDGDLDGRAAKQDVSPSVLEDSNGDGAVRKPLTRRVSKSVSKKPAWKSWVQAALGSVKKDTHRDTVGDEALQSHLKTMKKSQLMRLGKEIGIAMEVIDDANDGNNPKDALVELILNYKASHQVDGKHSRLMRMVTHADGDTEKIGKPTEEDFAELDNVERPVTNAHAGKVIMEHKFRGCFPLADETDLSPKFRDLACMKPPEGELPCRGGLPFFRLPMAAGQSYLDCFTFCLSKGLDLFGIVNFEKKKECRCGATVENAGAWHRQHPNKQLLLHSKKMKADDPKCRLLVWEYTGGLTEDDSVPYPLLQMSDDDRTYMENIAVGHDVTQEQGADDEVSTDINITIDDASMQPNASLLTMSRCKDDPTYDCQGKKGQCRNFSAGPTIRTKCPITCGMCTKNGSFPQLASSSPLRKCYPHNCAGGGGPWKTKRSDRNVYINYFFQNNVDSTRRSVFKAAAQEYHRKTCIRWVETTQTPRISVGIYDLKMCTASVGYPGPSGSHIINLGWCKDWQSLGSVIHEMGHAVGMNHEQNRKDGSARAVVENTWRGPYLNVHWQRIASDWRAQYVPRQDTYVGSAYDGPGDPHWGYESFDFRSLMLYGRSSGQYDTIPTNWNSVVGQRSTLSAGDLKQIKDLYQCGKPPPPKLPCKWWCFMSFGQCKWHSHCGGCSQCGGSSLLAEDGKQDTTGDNDGSSLSGSFAKESNGNEDPEDDIAIWVADAWGACRKGKVICARSRQVVCESPNGKEVEESKCDPSEKPLSEQACYCSERAEVPAACAIEEPKFGNRSCNDWRHGVDCLTIDPELPLSCPRTCGLC